MINYQRAQLFFYCREDSLTPVESFIDEHKLCFIVSGSLDIFHESKNYTFNTGDVVLFKRNQLVRAVLRPGDNGEPFSSFKIVFAQELLLKFKAENAQWSNQTKVSEKNFPSEQVPLSTNNELIVSFFRSLRPYLNADNTIPQALSDNKTSEILLIMEMLWPGVGHSLFNFETPGKIDLEQFMQKNFANNVPLTKLAYLTGRSLTSFKRDFLKIFGAPPHKWIMQRRLMEAIHLIKNEKQSPSEIYVRIGFESLAHFSTAFKRFFGYNPSTLAGSPDSIEDTINNA